MLAKSHDSPSISSQGRPFDTQKKNPKLSYSSVRQEQPRVESSNRDEMLGLNSPGGNQGMEWGLGFRVQWRLLHHRLR